MPTEKGAQNSVSMPMNLPLETMGSGTTTMLAPPSLPTGTVPSSCGLATLRDLVQSPEARLDAHTINSQLQASLKQDFGSRLAIRGEYGPDFDCRSVSASVTGGVDRRWVIALERLTAPSRGDRVAAEVTRLRSLTIKRKESETDLELSIGAFTEELCAYPFDIVRTVCRSWARNNKFFPALCEVISECEELMRPRRAYLQALRTPALLERKPQSDEYQKPTEAEIKAVSEMVGKHFGMD